MKIFKPLFLFLCLCLFSVDVKAQITEQSSAVEDNTIHEPPVEVEPEFPGGMAKFYKFVSANFKMPEDFKGRDKIIVSFVIEKDGSLTDIKVTKDIGYNTAEEAIRLIKASPKWKPGSIGGKPVRSQYTIPIMIVSE